MSIGWVVFGFILAIGLVAVLGFALVRTVGDARRACNNARWDRSELLDLTARSQALGSA
jgi:hypothetical protein